MSPFDQTAKPSEEAWPEESEETLLFASTTVAAGVRPYGPSDRLLDRASGCAVSGSKTGVQIPQYLRDIYAWAYLHRLSPVLLDRGPVVSAILWGNYRRLVRAAVAELGPGLRALQPACVYGSLSRRIALALGPSGHLDVCDVVPLQLTNCRRKLRGLNNVSLFLRDAASQVAPIYDVVCCFFLLHEMPAPERQRAVACLLRAVKPGGKVVFVDYHKPRLANPLGPFMWAVLKCLEPFAMDLWVQEIAAIAGQAGDDFTWSKTTYFGGLYQKIVAERLA